MEEIKKRYFVNLKKEQLKDFGLIAAIVFIFLGLYFTTKGFFIVAIVIALLTVLLPSIFYPFAYLWFRFSKTLGNINSKIILAIIFFLVVVPVGIFRRIIGKDSLNLKDFKKGKDSVMTQRNHTYSPSDLEHLF